MARFGIYDTEWAFSLYKWELDAVIKGRQLAQIDEREKLAVLATQIGYFVNAEKPKFKDIFNRDELEASLEGAYNPHKKEKTEQERLELYRKALTVFGERS